MENKYITRKIFKTGQSRAITLPAEWLNNQGKGNFQVTMVYNDDILVMATCENISKAQQVLKAGNINENE